MKKYILGMGAQKAGTTWVHDYINSHANADFGFSKEYHFLDLYSIDSLKGRRTDVISHASKKLAGKQDVSDVPAIHKLSWFNDIDYYFSYFENLLRNPAVDVTGDLTPTHAGLSVDMLDLINRKFVERGIEVYPLFLMRDPVDRLKSRAKMYFRNKKVTPSYEEELALMDRLSTSEEVRIRASYDETYRNMREIYGDRCFVGFYETLFSESEIRRLCDAVGIAYARPEFDRRLNVSNSPNTLADADVRHFKDVYHSQYEFAAREFGSDFIESIWR